MTSPRFQYWIFFVISLAGIVFFLIFIGIRLSTPSDGLRLEPGIQSIRIDGLIVNPISRNENNFNPGDLLIGVDGLDVVTLSQNILHPGLLPLESAHLYNIRRGNEVLKIPVTLKPYPFWQVVANNWGTILFAFVFLVVGTIVFVLRPANKAGWVLFLMSASLTSSTAWSFGLQVSDFLGGYGFWIFKVCTFLFYNLFWIACFHFGLIFPKPILQVQHQRWIIPVIYGLPNLFFIVYLTDIYQKSNNVLDWISRWSLLENLNAAVFLFLSLLVLIFQYRSNTKGMERQQIRWVIFAGLIAAGGGLLSYILPPLFGMNSIGPNAVALVAIPFPVAIGVAILRRNLFDIDTLISRTLVYGILTFTTMAIYVFSVGVVANNIIKGGETFIAFLTTGFVAIIFQPLRVRLQGWVNRLMYGERDDPVKMLSGLAKVLEQSGSAQDALKVITETVSRALKLPYVAIELSPFNKIIASYGLSRDELIRFPMMYQNETTGFLVVAPRSSGEPFNPTDIRLLENIAHQAGASAHAAKLTTNLQISRQKLVTTREEERRRIRRDLHDGLGPTLASLTLRMDVLRNTIRTNPEEAERLLDNLKLLTQSTIKDVRALVYELRPPALDELGLVEALKNFLGSQNGAQLQVSLNEQKDLPTLPAALEVAVYRIVTEGYNNVIRHAKAALLTINISIVNGSLIIKLDDDGVGMPEGARTGVGLASMRERAEELGGSFELIPSNTGFHIQAKIPLNRSDIE